MSAENVELLRRAYKAFNEGDRSVFLEHYDPDILLWVSPSYPESGTVLVRRMWSGGSPSSSRRSAVAFGLSPRS